MIRSNFFKDSERLDFATYLFDTHDEYAKDSVEAVKCILRDYNNDLDKWIRIAPHHQQSRLGVLKRKYTEAELKKLIESRKNANRLIYQTTVQGNVHNLTVGPTYNVPTRGSSSPSPPDKNQGNQEQRCYVNCDQRNDNADLLVTDEDVSGQGYTDVQSDLDELQVEPPSMGSERNSKRSFDEYETSRVDPRDVEELDDDDDAQHTSWDQHKRRKFIYNYLTDVTEEWSPGDHWIVGGIDITKMLMKFRKRTMYLSQRENIRDIRVLSLSYIFFMSPNQAESCLHRFKKQYHHVITKKLNCKEGWQSLPMQARHWCASMDEIISSSATVPTKKLRAMTRRFGDEADDNDGGGDDTDVDQERQDNSTGDLSLMALLLGEMVEAFDSWSDDWLLESTFIHQHLSPFMKQVFRHNHFMNTRQGETHVKNKPDSLLADYFVYHKVSTGDIFDIIAAEVKAPSRSSEGQLQSDFVKLGKEMKDMLDILLDYGVQDPIVGGILVKGYNTTTYTLRLVSDGVYWMSLHGKFELLRSPADVPNIPKIVEYFVQLRNLVYPTVLALDGCSDSENVSSSARKVWKRFSAATPVRTQNLRRP